MKIVIEFKWEVRSGGCAASSVYEAESYDLAFHDGQFLRIVERRDGGGEHIVFIPLSAVRDIRVIEKTMEG